jgi:hypothetical protein
MTIGSSIRTLGWRRLIRLSTTIFVQNKNPLKQPAKTCHPEGRAFRASMDRACHTAQTLNVEILRLSLSDSLRMTIGSSIRTLGWRRLIRLSTTIFVRNKNPLKQPAKTCHPEGRVFRATKDLTCHSTQTLNVEILRLSSSDSLRMTVGSSIGIPRGRGLCTSRRLAALKQFRKLLNPRGLHAHQFRVGLHMRRARHSHQRRRNSW